MVQSIGISIGNQNSYVAAGQGGGIEILLNEYSSRSTPSMVAFTDHARAIGVDASSNFFMNIKNTIYDLMLLVGKSYEEIVASEHSYGFRLEEAENGEALVVVRHLDQERKFTITQVLAMLFTKLRGVASKATDCVISCPQFFTDKQKDAITSAALIAGLNPLQIISDMSAVVLNYAYYRTTKEDSHKFIAFINFGQSNLQSVIAWLTPKEDTVRIMAAESEMVGGKDFDHLLANYFVNEHKLTLTPKAHLKLVASCEKLKKQLSANANDIPIHVESLISEDKDFSARIDRSKFEQLSENLLHRVEGCLRRCLESAKAFKLPESDDIKFELQVVEMVGGSTRIPCVKQLIHNVFNLAPSTTLNIDEAVARGCALHCAALHPGVIVKREVKILDSESFSKAAGSSCDKKTRSIEQELIEADELYMSRTEARNNLEEYIYSERSKLQEGDQFLNELSTTLDWLFSDEGEKAPKEEYLTRLGGLKKITESRLTEKSKSKTPEPKEEPKEKAKPDKKVEPKEAPKEESTQEPMEESTQEPTEEPMVESMEENNK